MTELELLNQFEDYLVKRGYTSRTSSGNRGVAYDYSHPRIRFVLRQENITIQTLVESINKYVTQYDVGGIKARLGETSHNSVINALKRFKEFLRDS